jgi:ribosome-associated heat shock protein Hsp15
MRVTGVAAPAVRVDKWLWAARFFKTRTLAAEAAGGGKVKVNGERAKPARAVRIGDELAVQVGPCEYIITVRGLSDRRGPASQAALLYEETATSRERRQRLVAQLAADRASIRFDVHRPARQDRRESIRRKKGWTD